MSTSHVTQAERAAIVDAFNSAMHSDVEQVELSTDLNGDLIVVNNGNVPATVRTVAGLYGVA